MKLRRLSLLAAVLLVIGCTSTSGKSKLNTISVEDEWQLGADLARDLSHQLQFVNDADALTYLRNIGQRMVAQSNSASLPWEFHIVRDDQAYVFGIPGGHVYVSTGLIKAAHSTSELAGAIGHEIGHLVNRHAAQELSQQFGVGEVAKASMGQNASLYQQILATAGRKPTPFTRDEEKEADDTAVNLMDKAGYDAKGVGNVFRTLLADRTKSQRYLASHPITEDQIKDADDKASKMTKRPTLITDEPEFHTIRERLQ